MNEVIRPYRSPRREEQAQATRDAVLDAAHALFLEQGYSATSIRAVAARANVSEQTVYNGFADKAGLLWNVAKRVITAAEQRGEDGDPEDGGLLAALRADADPLARIRIVARASRETWEHGMLAFEAMVFNPQVNDPRLDELRRAGWESKYANTRAVAELLFPDDIRRPGVGLDKIVDIAMAIDSAATVKTLVEDCGWTYDQFEAWLTDFMATQFLDPNR